MVTLFNRPKPTVLIIMDGVGVAPPGPGNAVTLAKTPFLDKYWPSYPHTYLKAAGLDVGLPEGTDGNSEVGHMNIGAGKIVYQELPRIDMAIEDKSFFKNPVILNGIKQMKALNTNFHIIGLVGGGKVHSSLAHLLTLIKLLSEQDIDRDRVFLHLFTDGRDSPPKSCLEYIQQVDMQCKIKSVGRIASLCGRYYAMDRDQRWDRTQKAYEMLTKGKGKKVQNWEEAVELSYREGITDEYIEPCVVTTEHKPIGSVEKGDVILFCNFRGDRAIQLTQAFIDKNFKNFEREPIEDIYFIGMTEYAVDYPEHVAFPEEVISNPLGRVLSDNGLTQLRIAESEKFMHVTHFFNCKSNLLYPGEDNIEVPSPKDVSTYDQKPEMNAPLLTDILVDKIYSNEYDFILVNFANPDMVAHTGVLDAAIKAMETTDQCIGRIIPKILDRNGAVIITADHGNIEELIESKTGGIDTKHSTNPVPLIVVKGGEVPRELTVGILADIAPTILAIMGIEKPVNMIGRNLLI